ncbi:MAG: hypothetical protein K9G58_15895 [Bacteroidales bacterium]|nr:hypothetical protein [Bacteroidales bacterium]MCF8387642.1 hypothetical protein [Bacteroidales bacterium]MCF8399650.1 hypothetical protein [Bacteroidales bacterium]
MSLQHKGRKKRKKVRYTKMSFKLSMRQKKSLMNYCHARKTTPTRLIKKMIKPYLENYSREVPEELYVTENQLDLFEEDGIAE